MNVGLLTHRISLAAYPDYASLERSSDVPGYILLEQYMVRGIRQAVPVGFLVSTAYFYLALRPRLSFADRSLARFHHYFYPSAGYATPLGAVVGALSGAAEFGRSASVETLTKRLEEERRGAERALELRERRRLAVVQRVRSQQSLWSAWRVKMGWDPDPVAVHLSRAGLSGEMTWQDMLVPYSLSWVRARSRTEAGDDAPRASMLREDSSPRAFDKVQVDYVVSQAMAFRLDETCDRYTKTAGRCSSCGVLACLLLWNSGNMFFRMNMGLGLGIFGGSLISASRIDEMTA